MPRDGGTTCPYRSPPQAEYGYFEDRDGYGPVSVFEAVNSILNS